MLDEAEGISTGRLASIIESSELRRCLVESGVGSENGSATLSLISDDPTHIECLLSSISPWSGRGKMFDGGWW